MTRPLGGDDRRVHRGSMRPDSRLVVFVTIATLTRVAGQTPFPPPPPSGGNVTDPNAPPAPPAALTIEEMKTRAAEKLISVPRFTKGEEQCYFFLRSDPSVQPMPDRFFLLPPGRTWGNVPFSVFNFTDEDFGTGFAPSGPEELIVDFEVVFTPIGSKVTTSDLYLMDEKGSVDSRFFRVLPSMPGDPNEVSETSTPYAWIDRASTAHADDVLTTMSTAGNVSAILKPDLPGTYMVLVTVLDSCNVTTQAVSNVTAFCAHEPVPRVGNETSGVMYWRQAEAMKHATETHAMGWWPPLRLDGSATLLADVREQYYYNHKQAVDALVSATAIFDGPTPGGPGATQVTIVNNGAPAPPAPPPPSDSPLRTREEWKQWTSAPAWDAPFNPADGLVYGWSLKGAPHGSNAWRRYFRNGNETESPKRSNAAGFAYLHAVAPEDGFLPVVEDPRNFLATFQPDVVGTYQFQLDVSNVCHQRTFKFETTFECNAAPVPGALTSPKDVGLCLARQEIKSNASDPDGDEVFVLWNQAFGPRGNASSVFPDGTPTGARDASAGMFLSDHTGDVTGFTPDVPGEYSLRMTVTDGCLVTASTVDVVVEWSAECADAGATAATFLTVLPALTCGVFVALSVWYLRRTPLNPLSPLTFRADAARLQRWEGFKMRVKFERLRESWELRAHREALARALKEKRRMKKGKAIKGDSRYGKAKRPLPPRVEGAWGEDPKQRGLQRGGRQDGSAIDPGGDGKTTIPNPTVRSAQRSFERAIATLAGATEIDSHLVPSSVHAWRVGLVVGIAAEGITLCALAFLRNTWWAPAAGKVGRAMGIIFDAPVAYDLAYASAALVVVALVSSQMARPVRGQSPPFAQRAIIAARRLLFHRKKLTAQELANANADRRARGEPEIDVYGREIKGTGKKKAAAAASSDKYEVGKSPGFQKAGGLQKGQVGVATDAKGKGVFGAADPHRGRRTWSRSVVRHLPSWACCVGGSWSATAAPGGAESRRRLASAAAQREASSARRALDVAAAGPFRVVARIVRECVHFVGDFHVPLLWLACEPMFVPAVAASAAMLTCNHADAKRPFPHLARDDELRCYVGRHGNPMFVGVLTALVLPCAATWYGVRVAPRQDLSARELPHFVALRVGARWFAAVFSVTQGEMDMTRRTPRGEYGIPSAHHDGWSPTTHYGKDFAHLVGLVLTCAALFALNYAFQPVRGRVGSAINGGRGAAYACALWTALMAYRTTCDAVAPVDGGILPDAAANGALTLLFLGLFPAAYCGWALTHARGSLFGFPDLSPREMRKHKDPRVRAMGVLVGNATDGIVGAFGHWEGLERQREREKQDRKTGNTHLITNGVNYTPGEGLSGLTEEAEDDVAEDALMWQLVLQSHFAGFGVDVDVRVHACEAVVALARSDDGVMCAQRCQLTPLIKRLLLDPTDSAIRLKAAEAVQALAKNFRGQALLCQRDIECHLACKRQRKREWYEALIYLERRYHRVTADIARIHYNIGLWQMYANKLLPPDRFMPLVDWNVRAWLDDGKGGMIDDSVLEGDEDAKKKVKNQQWELVKEVLFGKVDEEKARKRDAAERRKERRRRKAAERARQEAEMTVPQCLAQLLLDDDEHVVERAVKAVGAMLQGLRDAGGRRQPQEAERRMLLNARKIAGPLYRTAGLYSARKLPEHGEDEDAALKNTFDKKGATYYAVAQRDERLATVSGDSRSSGGSVSSAGSGDSRGSRGSSRGSGADDDDDDDEEWEAGVRRPSPMDFVLDAPGLIENLVMCTAHDCSQVRSAAHEVLTTTAQEDTVATLAFRVLDLLETVADWRGRVKAIEWINHLVAGRLKELAEAAVQANPSSSRRRADGSAENALYALQGGDEDLALGRDSVDLAAGVEHAPGELAGVGTMLSRHGVERIAACLDDRDAAPVRVAALQLLRVVWDTLAADAKGRGRAGEDDDDLSDDDVDDSRLAVFERCGVVARLVALREDDDKATTVYADLLVQRILQTAGRAAADAFDAASDALHPSDLHERVGELLDVARERSSRGGDAFDPSGRGSSPAPDTPGRGFSTPPRSNGAWSAPGSPGGTPGSGRGVTDVDTPRSGSGRSGTERTGAAGTTSRDPSTTTPRADALATASGGSSGRHTPPSLGGDADGRSDASNRAFAAHRWDEYVRDNNPPTVRYRRGVRPKDRLRRHRAAAFDAEEAARREPGRTAKDGLGRWAPFVVTRGKLVETRAEKLLAGDGAGDGDEKSAPGDGGGGIEFKSRVIRARMPVRAAPFAGAPIAPVRAAAGEPSGPGPSAPPVRGTAGAIERARAAIDRPTWRERASEYILAGGGARGVGGARRGPHERGVLRDGLVGWAGQANGPVQGPNEMFPHGSIAAASASLSDGDGGSMLSGSMSSRSRSTTGRRVGGAPSSGRRRRMGMSFSDVGDAEEAEEDPLAGLEGLEDPNEVKKKKKRFFGLF